MSHVGWRSRRKRWRRQRRHPRRNGDGGAGGFGGAGTGGAGGIGGAAPDSFCGLGAPPEAWESIQPQVDTEPLPRGVGGTIQPGTYELTRFIEHGDTSACLSRSGLSRYQLLVLLPNSSGTLVDEDNAFLHWPMTFTYAIRDEYFLTTITCSPYGGTFGVNNPFGPFGPFETFTASGNELTLFSPQCRYQATYELRSR